jgi:uncharacterized protein YndB with AHSA1/START domain
MPPLEAEVVVDASIDVVWDAYTLRERMEEWQVGRTDGMTLEIGSTFRTSYDAESSLDDDTVIESELLAFDPDRMFATRILRAPGDFPFPNAILDTWSVVYLEPVGENRTRVTIRMFGFDDGEESSAMRAFFAWGNPYEFEKLEEYLARE